MNEEKMQRSDLMYKVKRIQELVKQLNEYRDVYYNEARSDVSDAEYDRLFDELSELENETGVVYTNSPTQTVGYEVKSELEKVEHSHPMLSLDKTKSVDDLVKFAGDKDCILSLKMDGLTCLLTYENGELVQAETRGDGEIGELITHNAKVFENIPLSIDYKGHFEIEGEAIITYEDFDKINKSLPDDKKYKNPRNLASGSVRQLDSKIAAQRHIKFIAWKVPTDIASSSFINRLQYALDIGFDTVPFLPIRGNCNAEFINIVVEQLRKRAKEKSFPIDGLVATYNDITYGESLGTTGHHPKHSIAFKFAEDSAETVLREIEWSMGKTGSLTPVAIFDSVDLAGTSVSRASLHNISIMKELNVSIGSTVTVVKKNEIIPQIIYCDANAVDVDIPTTCPVCSGETQIVKENDSEVLMCTNPHCKGKLLGRVSHFVSKKGMDISGLSEETIKKFVELGWITEITDVYNLEKHYDRLSTMSGFGRKSVDKLRKSIENSKTVRLDKFITSLSIPGIGTSQSKELSKVFGTWNEFRDASVGCYNFTQLDGFGDVLNNNIHSWF